GGGCMPLHIAVRGAGSKMRACLRPIVEAEHGSKHPAPLVGQMDRASPATIGAAGMLELLQVHAKSVIELGHRPGEHDRPPARVLLHCGKTVLVRELPDGLDIGRGRPELLGVLLMGQVTLGLVAGGYFPDLLLQCVMLLMPQDQGDFQPFRRVRLSYALAPGNGALSLPTSGCFGIAWQSLLRNEMRGARDALRSDQIRGWQPDRIKSGCRPYPSTCRRADRTAVAARRRPWR